MQALDQHETRAVRTHQDWRLLADVEHTGGDFVHPLLHERGPAFDRHVDIGNRESLAFHHDRGKDSMSFNRYAKFNGDRGAFLFMGIGLQATRSSIGESYAKWIKETCLDIHTGP